MKKAVPSIGDSLEFIVWDSDELNNRFLGKATLSADAFFPGGFQGELDLAGSGSRKGVATLVVRVGVLGKDLDNIPENFIYENMVSNWQSRGSAGRVDVTISSSWGLRAEGIAFCTCEIPDKPASRFQ